MGGQTALNTALALAENGALERYGVQLIGANREAIAKAEDRDQFRTAMLKIGLDMPLSAVAHTLGLRNSRAGGFSLYYPSFFYDGRNGRRDRL